jgi:hypothetical protein
MPFIAADNGKLVDEGMERLARVIQDYDHNLTLAWIPPENRSEQVDRARPYVVLDTAHRSQEWPQGAPVIYAGELDSPADILERLWKADNKNGNVLDKLESHNAAVEALRLKALDDRYTDMADQAEFLLKRAGNYVNWGKDKDGKKIKLDDQRRRIE